MFAGQSLPELVEPTLMLVGLVSAIASLSLSLLAINHRNALDARFARVFGTNVTSQLRIATRLIELETAPGRPVRAPVRKGGAQRPEERSRGPGRG